MKIRPLLGVFLCAGLALPAFADEAKEAKKAPAAAGHEAADAPGEHHQVLARLAGTWTTASKSWMGPGEPTVSAGSVEAKLILDGRFLEEHFTSTMLGKPMSGMGMLGYDNGKKKFVATWLDSMSTGIGRGEGTLDAAGKVLTMHWTATSSSTGKPAGRKVIQRLESDSRRVSEFYEKGADGKEKKILEIVYTK